MARKRQFPNDDVLHRACGILSGEDDGPVDLMAEYSHLAESYKKLLRKFFKTVVISDSFGAQQKESSGHLEMATSKYRQLKKSPLPICMYCKKVHSDAYNWQSLETFLCKQADIMFSHGICPSCIKTAYSRMGLKNIEGVSGKPAEYTGTGRTSQQTGDGLLARMRECAGQLAADNNPLAAEMELFAASHGKLLHRFNKTVSISDRYQSQLMDLKLQMEMMARTDLLTGLANRWEMTARLDAEVSRAQRHGSGFSMVLADIDHFKSINDTHGHLAGDRVLHAIAEVFRASIRSEDSCCRWGGEEFLFILPETDLEGAGKFASKILAEIRNMSVSWEGHEIRICMSAGYGVFTRGTGIDSCIRLIDKALSIAKSSGRDRAIAAHASPEDH